MPSQTDTWVPVGRATFSSLASAITLGSSTPTAGTAYASLVNSTGQRAYPNHAIISIETQPVRVTDDGTTPTAAVGELNKADTKLVIENAPDAIRNTKIIETTASAAVTVRYYI